MAVLALALSIFGEAAGRAEEACPAHLFIIARSKNANLVVYDANRGPAGDLNASEPVVAYWLLNGEPDKREKLNRIERERAYGFDTAPGDAPGTYTLTFKARKKRHFLVRMLKGCPVVTATIGGQTAILRRLFVQSKEDDFLPKVEYIEFFGEDAESGAPVYEKFVPEK